MTDTSPLVKATGILDEEMLLGEIKKGLEKKFGGKVVEKNIEAIKRAFQEVTSDE